MKYTTSAHSVQISTLLFHKVIVNAFLQSPCGASSAFQKLYAFSFMFMLTFCTNDNVIAPLWHFIFQWYLQKLQMTFVKCPIWIGCINKFAFRSFSEKCFLHGFPQKRQNWWMLRQIRSGVSLNREREKAALRVCFSPKILIAWKQNNSHY